jgi:hypothetical protein
MPQKKVKLVPAGTKGTPGRQSTLTKAGNALRQAKDRAAKSPVKPLGARLDQAAANEKRAATREANKAAKAAAQAAAQAELDKTRQAHLDQHNAPHQIHGHISDIANKIVDAHINGEHENMLDHAQHLDRVLSVHDSALNARGAGGSHLSSIRKIERVKGLLRKVGKNKEVSADTRRKANIIANDHLTHHVPDAPAPKALKPAKPGIVDRIRSMFAEEYELHEDYGAGDVGTDEVVRKYKSMTPGEQKNEVKLSESYVLWLVENEQLDEASFHSNLKALLHPDFHRAVKKYLGAQAHASTVAAAGAVAGGLATGGHPLGALAGGAAMLVGKAHKNAGEALMNAYDKHQEIAKQHDDERRQ